MQLKVNKISSDSLLMLAEGLSRLEDSLLRLADRLVDNPIFQLSASLYLVYIQRVMSKTEDMAVFFTYSVVIWYNEERVRCIPKSFYFQYLASKH